MTDTRIQLLKNWLNSVLDSTYNIETASSDASFRRYFRVLHKGISYIAMDAPPEHENIKPFIDIAELIVKAQVNAPTIFFKNLEDGFLLLSDLGKQDYLPNLHTGSADRLYTEAMQALLAMQTTIQTQQLPAYNATLLESEMNLFDEWFLQKHLCIQLTTAQKEIITDIKQTLIKNALEQPQVFVHRDYHSRNLMLTESHSPGVIDFQDAVIGPVTYDLVSLLRDCYIKWPDDKVYQWVSEFYKASMLDIGLDKFIRWFDLMGLQRHIKVLGIFARLYHRDGKSGYLKDLPLTYEYTKMITGRYPELAHFDLLLHDLNIEALLLKPSSDKNI